MSRRIWLPKFMGYFMAFLMAVAVVSIIGLPWIVKGYVTYVYHVTGKSFIGNYFMAVLYSCGFLALIILHELRKMFNSCAADDPFVQDNVTGLKRIGFCALAIGGVFVTKVVLFFTFLTAIVVFVFLVAAMMCFVLADVFEVAVRHKHDIDLTI